MARRKKEIEITVIDNPEDSNVRLVQINGHTIGTITQSDNRFDCVVGDSTFHEKSEEEALHQVVREYNLHQR